MSINGFTLRKANSYSCYEIVDLFSGVNTVDEETVLDNRYVLLLYPRNCGTGRCFILYAKDGIVVLEEDVLVYNLVEEVLGDQV